MAETQAKKQNEGTEQQQSQQQEPQQQTQQPQQQEQKPQQPQQKKQNVDQFGKPLRRVKFMNNEDPDLDMPFSFQPNGGHMEKYHLYPGYEYELPDYIVKHLNNLEYPTYQTQFDEKTGQVTHVRAGSFNRVTCHPVE